MHHLRKADADDPFDTVSGTLGLTGAPDTIMIIWREGNGVLLAAKGRDIEEVKKAIQFDPKTCLWTIIGDAEVVQRSAARSTVIKALEEATASRWRETDRGSDRYEASQCAPASGHHEARGPYHRNQHLRQIRHCGR